MTLHSPHEIPPAAHLLRLHRHHEEDGSVQLRKGSEGGEVRIGPPPVGIGPHRERTATAAERTHSQPRGAASQGCPLQPGQARRRSGPPLFDDPAAYMKEPLQGPDESSAMGADACLEWLSNAHSALTHSLAAVLATRNTACGRRRQRNGEAASISARNRCSGRHQAGAAAATTPGEAWPLTHLAALYMPRFPTPSSAPSRFSDPITGAYACFRLLALGLSKGYAYTGAHRFENGT